MPPVAAGVALLEGLDHAQRAVGEFQRGQGHVLDLKLPIGWLLSAYGVLLTVYGLLTKKEMGQLGLIHAHGLQSLAQGESAGEFEGHILVVMAIDTGDTEILMLLGNLGQHRIVGLGIIILAHLLFELNGIRGFAGQTDTAGLDPVAAAALREDLAALVEQRGVTVFLTTHNLNEAERLCARVAVIDKGKLLATGSPDELRSRQGGQRLEIHGRGFNDTLIKGLNQREEIARVTRENQHLLVDLKEGGESAAIVSFLVQSGVEIEEVRKGKASLEEAFLTLLEVEND